MENPFRIQKGKLISLRGSAYQMTTRKQAKTSGNEPLFELSCQKDFLIFLNTAFASLGERPECCVDFRGQLISLDFFASFFYQEPSFSELMNTFEKQTRVNKKNDGGSISVE